MSLLEKYIKQEKQKEIIEAFDAIFKLAVEANRNREYWEAFKSTKYEALNRDIRGKDLEKFISPLIDALDDKNLESSISKEDREAEKAIWENYELKVKREALKSKLNYMFKQFIVDSRNNNANDLFIQKIKEKQKECYKLAYSVDKIDAELKELKIELFKNEYQLNANQKAIKAKFDKLIDDLIKIQEINNISINQYNSGTYGDDSNSLWTEIFELKKESISMDINNSILENVIRDLHHKIEKTIQRITLNRDIKEEKRKIEAESFENYIESLSPRQLEIRNKFLDFQKQFVGEYNKEFWENAVFPLKKEAIENEVDDEKLQDCFRRIQNKAN